MRVEIWGVWLWFKWNNESEAKELIQTPQKGVGVPQMSKERLQRRRAERPKKKSTLIKTEKLEIISVEKLQGAF